MPRRLLASAFIYLGDAETALGLFRTAIDERDTAVKHMAVEPLYDRIRADPRFRAFLGEVGLADVAANGTTAIAPGGQATLCNWFVSRSLSSVRPQHR